jgi:acetylornithine deacetylase/succinyl-diaminopimelate desuccinylase-like protein
MSDQPVRAAFDWLQAHEQQDRDRLAKLVAIPSVSSDPASAEAVREAVEWVAAELRRIGFADVTVYETPLHPAVTARLASPIAGAPTVLVYGHVDVQPVEPVAEWASPPFTVTERDAKLFGRGVTDDKGQLLMHLRSVEALLATAGGPPVNLVVLVDAEEEIGSPSLPALLADNPWLGEVDLVVVSDSPMLGINMPAVGYSLRGLVYAEVTVSALAGDLHSGQFGGAVPNAAAVLAELVAGLHDADGRVAVEGFYDDAAAADDAERAMLADLPFDERTWLDGIGARCGTGEAGYSALERTWIRPTLEVNGIVSGHTGPGPKTIVPARATAKLSMRLIADQDPHRVGQRVVDHLMGSAPESVDITADYAVSSRAVSTPRDHPSTAVAAEALAAAFGRTAYLIRDGGTIPAVALLQSAFGLDTLLLGLGCPDENKHAPNEWLPLDHFRLGPRALVLLWHGLGGGLR